MHRRSFLRLPLLAPALSLAGAATSANTAIDQTLREGITRRKIPAVVAMAAGPNNILYQGAFGTRDSSGVPVRLDSIFSIASMTKAITTVAALQLVERGKLRLDQPVAPHLPALANVKVLDGFDPASGKPRLHAVRTPITLAHLLTHTSGFVYDTWDEDASRYSSKFPNGPEVLMFEPGSRWQYGTGVDWTGRLVEAVSGMNLEAYFQSQILRPLGMTDTSFLVPPSKFERYVTRYARQSDGTLQQLARTQPQPPKEFNGGGGLVSTAGDYTRFLQMILNQGRGPQGVQILSARTVESMGRNHIGDLTAGKMKSQRLNLSLDVDIQPGQTEKWGLGFLINTAAYPGGRAAGSLAWAGLYNTYFWVDPKSRLCAVILMQYLPFVDKEAIGLLSDFEHALYARDVC